MLLLAPHLLAPFFLKSALKVRSANRDHTGAPSLVLFSQFGWLLFFCQLVECNVHILISLSLIICGIYEVSYVCAEVYDAAKATNDYFTVTSLVTYFSDRSVHGVDYQMSRIIKRPRSGLQNTD